MKDRKREREREREREIFLRQAGRTGAAESDALAAAMDAVSFANKKKSSVCEGRGLGKGLEWRGGGRGG